MSLKEAAEHVGASPVDFENQPITEVAVGEHFWGIMQGKLAVFLRTEEGYYVCGEWECSIDRGEFEIIELIWRPANCFQELYYK